MKHLYLIRHAKSSWDDPNQTDFERTLNERGERDAPKMAQLLISINVKPNFIISSPATRAITTAEIFAKHFKYPENKIVSDARIYEASTRYLADVVHEIRDEYETVLLFGHNPGISNFANQLSKKAIFDLPTCGIAGLELEIDSWSTIERQCGKPILFEYPKKMLNQ